MVTLKEREKIKEDIEKRFGLADALPLFMLLKEPQLKAIQAGDFSSVPDAIRAAGLPWDGITGTEKTTKTKTGTKSKSTNDGDRIGDGGQLERVEAETIPADFETDIKAAIDNQLYNFIDLNVFDDSDDPPEKKFRRALKDNPRLWGAFCTYIKEYIQKNKLTYDWEYVNAHGTNRKDKSKEEKLEELYYYYCDLYGMQPYAIDLARFRGSSRASLYNTTEYTGDKSELTPKQIDSLKKCKNIQEVSLARVLVDGRGTGGATVFATKNITTWKDEKTIEHTATVAALPVSDLPKLSELGIRDD